MFKERRTVTPKVSILGMEPVVCIMPVALEKMYYYVKHCGKEIGWLGKVVRDKNAFVVEDVYLFSQEVHATTCEISPASLGDFVTGLFTTDPDNAMDIANNLKLWGHSHVNMGVSPSGQDNDQMKVFEQGNPWFLRVIANKNGEMEFTLYDYVNRVTYQDIKWIVYSISTPDLEKEIQEEIKSKVKEKSYSYSNTGFRWKDSYYDEWEKSRASRDYASQSKTRETEKKQEEKVISLQKKMETVSDSDDITPLFYLEDGKLSEHFMKHFFDDGDIENAMRIRNSLDFAKYLDLIVPSNTFIMSEVNTIWMFLRKLGEEKIQIELDKNKIEDKKVEGLR